MSLSKKLKIMHPMHNLNSFHSFKIKKNLFVCEYSKILFDCFFGFGVKHSISNMSIPPLKLYFRKYIELLARAVSIQAVQNRDKTTLKLVSIGYERLLSVLDVKCERK